MDNKFDFSKISDLLNEAQNKLVEAKGCLDAWKASQPAVNESSHTEMVLSELPFKTYHTKQPAGCDEAGWIFSNTQGAETLLSTLKNNNGKATIGSFEYQLQGAEQQFIGRKPVK
jgi:ketopantoate hydroxymethyltransferase